MNRSIVRGEALFDTRMWAHYEIFQSKGQDHIYVLSLVTIDGYYSHSGESNLPEYWVMT